MIVTMRSISPAVGVVSLFRYDSRWGVAMFKRWASWVDDRFNDSLVVSNASPNVCGGGGVTVVDPDGIKSLRMFASLSGSLNAW